MNLDELQKRLVYSKPFGTRLIKGVDGSGKTTTLIYRLIHLKNNYCLYDNDKVIYISCKNNDLYKDVKFKYEEYIEDSDSQMLSLFSQNTCEVDFTQLDILIQKTFKALNDDNNCNFKYCTKDDIKEKFKECLIKYSSEFKSKVLNINYLEFLYEEINFIKQNNMSKDEYLGCIRRGLKKGSFKKPSKVPKDSNMRKEIFNLYTIFNKQIKDNYLVDDAILMQKCIDYINTKDKHYTHVLVDDIEDLDSSKLEFLKALCSKKVYSSLMITTSNLKYKKNEFLNSKVVKLKGNHKNMGKEDMFIEQYEYIDLRYKSSVKLVKDDLSKNMKVIFGEREELCSEETLIEMPVYSDIAAGEPILMSHTYDEYFSMPNDLIRNTKNCFMLHVKGDSMINANIEDGDLVVIRQQNNANNGEIVAVDIDGSATLKRFRIQKGRYMLLPENTKYKPIELFGTDARLLGIAVGIIKNKSN